MAARHNLILIHGAWAGSWGWSRLVPLLARQGWHPVAVDLPGNGADGTPVSAASLDLYVAHVLKVAATLDGPLTIIGHSGAGVVASQLGEAIPERVASLVYLAGMMLPSGLAFDDIVARISADHADAAGIGRYLLWSEDGTVSRVPPEAAVEIFFHDCDPQDALWAAHRLTAIAESGKTIRPLLTAERYGRIPRIYVEAAFDRSVVPAAQALMQQLSPGARRFVMETGHAPQLAQPERLADLLDRAILETCREL